MIFKCVLWWVDNLIQYHDDVIKWKHFPRYWTFVRGIHRSPVNSTNKGQWRGALMFSFIYSRINGWVNNREAGDLRRICAHYDVIVMTHLAIPAMAIRATSIFTINAHLICVWPRRLQTIGPNPGIILADLVRNVGDHYLAMAKHLDGLTCQMSSSPICVCMCACVHEGDIVEVGYVYVRGCVHVCVCERICSMRWDPTKSRNSHPKYLMQGWF